MPSFTDRLQHAWNAFMNRDPTRYRDYGISYYSRPDRPYRRLGNDRSIITAIYNRIAMDVASVDIRHVKLDENDSFIEEVKSGLNNCLQVEANVDQTGRAFIQDLVMSMFDEGVVAVVPVDTSLNPNVTGSYDIETIRTGKVVRWYPEHVTINLYNDKTGRREDVTLPKKIVSIIENPFYSIMNEPNSTLQRLIRKLNLLDAIDEQSGAGKLDLIIQLPYVIKTDARRAQAEQRRKDIEMQLAGTKYGIAYTDGTERITQLNRSVDNNLMKQIEYLTSMLYSQLGLSEEIFKGTADEKTMLNYTNGTIEPILSAICDEFIRKFLTKTARTQKQTIKFFREPFKLVPVDNMAEIADKFTRNEILSSNEIRQIIGFKPSDNPKADQLINSNINQSNDYLTELLNSPETATALEEDETEDNSEAEAELDELDSQLDELEKLLHVDNDPDFLQHYASKYYDPQKAHEYYMRTRQLKGYENRYGGVGGRGGEVRLNAEGREALSRIKAQLQAERKREIEESKGRRDETIKQSKEELKRLINDSKVSREEKIKAIINEAKALNQREKERADANKEKVRDTHKKSNEKEKQKKDQEIKRYTKRMTSEIEKLRAQLKSMSKYDRKLASPKILLEIKKLRNKNKTLRENLSLNYKEFISKSRDEMKKSLDDIRNTYKTRSTANNEHKKKWTKHHRDMHKQDSAGYRILYRGAVRGAHDDHRHYVDEMNNVYKERLEEEKRKLRNNPYYRR